MPSDAQTKALVISATYPDSQAKIPRNPLLRRGCVCARLLRARIQWAAACGLLAAVKIARGSFFITLSREAM
jgi:hypothetical protein